MDEGTLAKLEEFVTPCYARKDELHGLGHVQRLLAGARKLSESDKVDDEVLVFGAHFHGLVGEHDSAIRSFLAALGLEADRIELIITVAWESGKASHPQTGEGAYLHDAHLIEGGKAFGVAKWLITEALRGQTLEETLDFIESNLLGEFTCVTPRARALYAEQEEFTREFVAELRQALGGRARTVVG